MRERKIRERNIGVRPRLIVAAGTDAPRSMVLVHDQLLNGRRFRTLNVVDDVAYECPTAILRALIQSYRITWELTTLIERRGRAGMMLRDNGMEITSHAIFSWAIDQRVEWLSIDPG